MSNSDGVGSVGFRNDDSIVTLTVPSAKDASEGSVVEIQTFGAHVTKWRESRHPDMLFLSSKAVLDGSKAIRGGIPLIFPQFGPLGPLKQHGFARTSLWTVADHSSAVGVASVSFRLHSNPSTEAEFPHPFELLYRVSLHGSESSTLECHWSVKNLSADSPMTFTSALHTYFYVKDIDAVSLKDVSSLKYIDNLRNDKEFIEEKSTLRFSEEVDRVYCNTPSTLELDDAAHQRIFTIWKNSSLPDAVAWNPWVEKAHAMSDFADEEFKKMVCVEAGSIGTPSKVTPLQEITMHMKLSCEYYDSVPSSAI